MPRSSVPGFVGPSNVTTSPILDAEDTINAYVQFAAPGTGRTADALIKRPGLVPRALVADSPGHIQFFQDGRWFGITGNTFWECSSAFAITIRGTVGGSNHYSIVSNGTAGGQLLICDGFDGYVFTLATNVLTQINNTTFPGTGFPYGAASCVEFMDGYGFVVQRNSRKFFTSALEDFTSWDPLDVYERSEGSDNLVTICRNHRELWLPGTKTGEVWYDSGDALTPIQPVPGVFLEMGAAGGPVAAGGTIMVRAFNTVAWVGQNEAGQNQVLLANGYQWTPISTPPVDAYLQGIANQGRINLWAMQIEGHDYLVVQAPDETWTWIYDQTASRVLGKPCWVKWAQWNSTACVWEPWKASSYAHAFNKHMVTSSSNGAIYEVDPTAYSDGLIP